VSGRRPALYFTRESFARVLAGDFEDYATWPRSVVLSPADARWTFWQFADNGRVRGIETLVDLDVARSRDTLER
jgi:lysozyme